MAHADWTPFAELELEEIAYYIAFKDHRPATADRIVDEIHEKSQFYAENPSLGQSRPDLGDDIRIFRHKRWIVAYVPFDDGIRVVRVVDAQRDYPRLF